MLLTLSTFCRSNFFLPQQLVTARAPKDIALWTNHISGATALLDLRGTDQLKTEAGIRLFLHLRYQIVRVYVLSFRLT